MAVKRLSHYRTTAALAWSGRERSVAFGWSAFLGLVVSSPWLLQGGYLFGTDWPGPRQFDYPMSVSNWAPLEVVLATVSRIISGEWAGKLFVLALLVVSAFAAYRAAPVRGFVPGAVASTIYLLNPFVYGRIHYGQLFLLAGYALLPTVAIAVRILLVRPSYRSGLLFGVVLVVIAITSSHVFLMAVVLTATLLTTEALGARDRLQFLQRLTPSLLTATGVTMILTSYWLVPLVLGHGPIADVLSGVGSANLGVYRAVPDDTLGLLPNLLGLYGFWAENSGRFASMKLFVPYWPAVLALLLSLGAVGVVDAVRSRRDQLAPWVAGLLAAAAVALVLEMGVSHPLTSGLVTWLDSHFPIYRGMRDAGKWAALLAFVYSQLAALGAVAVLQWLKARAQNAPRIESLTSVATGLLIALPLYYGNGLLFGMHGEIRPSQYPAGWYQADRVLASDAHPGRALFLPWHEYMTYSFIQNQNKVVAPPAPTFFSVPVLVSTNPDVPGTPSSTDPDHAAIDYLVAQGSKGSWEATLRTLGVKYVLVAREVHWQAYWFLDHLPDIVKVGDYGSIVLYRVQGVGSQPATDLRSRGRT